MLLNISSRPVRTVILRHGFLDNIFRKSVCLTSSPLYQRADNSVKYINSRSYCSEVSHRTNAATKIKDGLLVVSLPLPLRNESCDFTLRPFSQTVGDFIAFIRHEDDIITTVQFFTKDGNLIAKSTTIDALMKSDFKIKINDQSYDVSCPLAANATSPEADIEGLDSVRRLVARLHAALHVEDAQRERQRRARTRLEQLQAQAEPLESQCAVVTAKAAASTRRGAWLGLGAMALQFGVLARLTWWEFAWDIMEPLTYFVTAANSLAFMAYFLLTTQDFNLSAVRDRQMLIKFHKLAEKEKLDVDKLNKLREEIAEAKHDLQRPKDSLQKH